MQAHNSDIEEYLGTPRAVFVVPVYQRNYDWKEANCRQLFRDICGTISTGKEHFLGTICFKTYNSRERSIIDGQQRLTSITLLLKALYDITDSEGIQDEIHDYLYNKGHSISGYEKIKLHLNKRDDVVYQTLLDNTLETVDEKLTNRQKESRVYQNYRLFADMLHAYFAKDGNASDILDSLCRLTIVDLEIQDENPQEIFESLNSTGMDLTNVDLLRNYILMQFSHEQQTELYEQFWSKIEDAVGVDHMEQFFVDYLIFKRRSDAISIGGRRSHVNGNNLYTAFKNYYNSLDGDDAFAVTRNCFADMKRCAELYRNFIFAPDISIEKESLIRRKLYYLLDVNDFGKSKSLLLYVFSLHERGKIDEHMVNQALDAITSMSFRAKVCKAKGFNGQFSGNVMIRLDAITDYSQFVEKFWDAITAGNGSFAFPPDEEFMQVLTQKNLYSILKSRGTKYMLYMFEIHSPFHKGIPSFGDDTLSIEHVMPQTLTDTWKQDLPEDTLENYDTFVTRLGNLTLTNYNSEMSNKSFADKQKTYRESNFYYTRDLTTYKKWTSVEISRRTEMMAKEALKIWNLPDKYQKNHHPHESLHTLDEDFTQFAYTKPSVLLIQDEEVPVSAWTEVLPAVCQSLQKDDKEAFTEIAQSGEIGSFVRSDQDHDYAKNMAYTHVGDNLYLRTSMSAYSTLNTVARLVTAFDQKADTDFKNNILFSLR